MMDRRRWSRVLLTTLCAVQVVLLAGCNQAKTADDAVPTAQKKHKTPPPCDTFDSASSPIKGCCGSMTFHSANDWKPVSSAAGESYCTDIPKQASYSVAMDDNNQPFATLTGAWTVTVNSYVPDSSTMDASKEGVLLTANPDHGCDPANGNVMSVTLSPLTMHPDQSGNVGFYRKDGPQSKSWGHNRRFRDEASYKEYDCKKDRDMCERIGSVTANGQTKKCTDAQCTVYLLR